MSTRDSPEFDTLERLMMALDQLKDVLFEIDSGLELTHIVASSRDYALTRALRASPSWHRYVMSGLYNPRLATDPVHRGLVCELLGVKIIEERPENEVPTDRPPQRYQAPPGWNR